MLREATSLQRRNAVPAAIEAYERLLALWPELPDAWFNLAYLQRQAGRPEDALHAYQKALDAGVSSPEEAHLNRSVIYTDIVGDHASAERELLLALKINPEFTPGLLNLANLYEDLNRGAAAAGLYEKILRREPGCHEALARYANLLPVKAANPPVVAALRRALHSGRATAAERASLGFALGRLLDAAADYPAAFAAYRAANEASRESVPGGARYDRGSHEAFVERLIAPDQSAVAVAAVPERRPESGEGLPRPIFICGMFRSGSTLLEQLLAACTGLAAGGELDFIPRLVAEELSPFPESFSRLTSADLDGIAARYREHLGRIAPGAPLVIDKRPDNFLYIGLIKRLFPDARIINTLRDPLDNCLSIYFLHLDQRMSYALDLGDIAHYYRQYRLLMAHWKGLFAEDIIDFNYDELVKEPAATMSRLCASLGLAWSGQMPQALGRTGNAIKTASVWQVREPLYRRSSGRAQHYLPALDELRAALAQLP